MMHSAAEGPGGGGGAVKVLPPIHFVDGGGDWLSLYY